MEIKSKRGIQLGQAFGAVLSLVLVAVLVVIAIYMLVTLGSSMLPTTQTTVTVVNETFAPTTTGTYLAAGSTLGLINPVCTITSIYNGSTALVVGAGNYSQSNCNIRNLTSTTNAAWKVNYNYAHTAPSSAYNASGSIVTNFSGYPTLVGLTGTIVFLGLVIGVLVASMVFGKKGV